MPQRTLYEVLMLHPSADSEIINTVYRQLAKRHHPDRDRSPDASARMAELNDAFATLRDPVKRARYDELLEARAGSVAPSSAPGAINLRYHDGTWSVRKPEDEEPADPYGEAGPPPAYPPPTGGMLSFGRYRGWTVPQVEYYDRNYLEWLQRTPAGRAYRQELTKVLSRAG